MMLIIEEYREKGAGCVGSALEPATRAGGGDDVMAQSVAEAVILVVARFKNVEPADIKLADKLSDWEFDLSDRRALAQKINLHFWNGLRQSFNPWLHPSETAKDQMIATIAKKVTSRNPRARRDTDRPAQ